MMKNSSSSTTSSSSSPIPPHPTESTPMNDPNTTTTTTNNNNNNEQSSSSSSSSSFKKKCTKIIIATILIGFIAYVIIDSLTNRHVKDAIDEFLDWIENNPIAGVFVFTVVYFVATVLFIPGSVLTLGSGFVFANAFGLGPGVLLASLSVFVGASAGAMVAFLLGRYLLRDWVQTLTTKYPLFLAIDKALEVKGFRIMTLLRLSPIIPFNALNYIGGITAVSFSAFSWALVAILPGTVLYVFLGASAGSLADSTSSGDNNLVTILSVVVGIVFGGLAIFATSFYAKKELRRVIEQQEAAAAAAMENVPATSNVQNDMV